MITTTDGGGEENRLARSTPSETRKLPCLVPQLKETFHTKKAFRIGIGNSIRDTAQDETQQEDFDIHWHKKDSNRRNEQESDKHTARHSTGQSQSPVNRPDP